MEVVRFGLAIVKNKSIDTCVCLLVTKTTLCDAPFRPVTASFGVICKASVYPDRNCFPYFTRNITRLGDYQNLNYSSKWEIPFCGLTVSDHDVCAASTNDFKYIKILQINIIGNSELSELFD